MDVRFFIDTGEVEHVREAVESGVVQAVASNPQKLVATNKTREKFIEEVRQFTEVPIAVQAIKTTAPEIVQEAMYLSGLSKNVVVKIATNQEGIKAIIELVPQGVLTNSTLMFSPSQALVAGLAGSPYISPFVGRARDNAADGIRELAEMRRLYDAWGIKTKIIAASIKDVRQAIDSIFAGVDAVAIPYKVFKDLFTHPLTRDGFDKFVEHWTTMVE